jgi:hypothetical protein
MQRGRDAAVQAGSLLLWLLQPVGKDELHD